MATLSLLVSLKLQICDFDAHRDFEQVRETLGIDATAPPFVLLPLEDHPQRQQVRGRKWAADNFGHIILETPCPKPADRLRVG